jgi:hypothetical protein
VGLSGRQAAHAPGDTAGCCYHSVQSYAGYLVEWARAGNGWRLVIVGKAPGKDGFVVHLRRWVVKQTFAG